MIFQKTAIGGLYLVEPKPFTDERGWCARVFCREEFAKAGIQFSIAQVNRSLTKRRGALRGLHYQKDPAWEAKVVMYSKGAMYNVAVDLRAGSPMAGCWEAF